MVSLPKTDLEQGFKNLEKLLSISEKDPLGLVARHGVDENGKHYIEMLQRGELNTLQSQHISKEEIDKKFHRYILDSSDLKKIKNAGNVGVKNGSSYDGLKFAYDMIKHKAVVDYKMADYASQKNYNSTVNMGNYEYGGGMGGHTSHYEPHRPAPVPVDHRHPEPRGQRPPGPVVFRHTERRMPMFDMRPDLVYERRVNDINGLGNRKPGAIGSAGATPIEHQQAEVKKEDPLKEVNKVEVKQEKKDERVIPLVYTSVGLAQSDWERVLSSHGIKIDTRKKIADPEDPSGKKQIDNPNYRHMVVESSGTEFTREYDLTQKEFDDITSAALKGKNKYAPLQPQVDAINKVIANDYSDKITYAMLKSDQKIDIKLKPELEEKLEGERKVQQPKETVILDPRLQQEQQNMDDIDRRLSSRVDLSTVVYAKAMDDEISASGKRMEANVSGMWVEKISADERREDIRTALLQGADGKVNSQEFASKVELIKDVDPGLLTFDKDKGETKFVSLDPTKEAGEQKWNDILSSHGIQLMQVKDEAGKENYKIELTTAGGGHFIDQRNTFTIDPDIAKTITSTDNSISEQKRLDALNSVIANKVDGGKVTREMLRDDKNIPVLADTYQPERVKSVDDPAYRISSQSEITTKASDQLKDWKDKHPEATEQEVNHQRGIIEKEVRDNVYARDYGYKEAPKVGMSNKDMKEYANRVADAMIVREIAKNPEKYGDLTERQLQRATEPLREKYYDQALNNAKKYQDNSDTYKLTAVVNGKEVTANLTEKQYNAYVNGDTATRMKIMDKALEEVKIKGPHIPWQVKAQMFSDILNTAIGTAIDVGHGYYAVRDAWREPRPEPREHPHGYVPMFSKDFGAGVHWDSGAVEAAYDRAIRGAEPEHGMHHGV